MRFCKNANLKGLREMGFNPFELLLELNSTRFKLI